MEVKRKMKKHVLARFYKDLYLDEEVLSFETFLIIAKNYLEVET